MDNFLNLFWAIVWGVALILAIVSIFSRIALAFLIGLAAYMCGVFVYDYIRVKRMK